MMYMMDSCFSSSCDYFNSISVLKLHAKGENKSSDGELSLHMCMFLNYYFFIIHMVSHTYVFWTKGALEQCCLFLTPLNFSNIRGNQVIFKPLCCLFFEQWGKIFKNCFKVDLRLSLFSPSYHSFCATTFQKRFSYFVFKSVPTFSKYKNFVIAGVNVYKIKSSETQIFYF